MRWLPLLFLLAACTCAEPLVEAPPTPPDAAATPAGSAPASPASPAIAADRIPQKRPPSDAPEFNRQPIGTTIHTGGTVLSLGTPAPATLAPSAGDDPDASPPDDAAKPAQ